MDTDRGQVGRKPLNKDGENGKHHKNTATTSCLPLGVCGCGTGHNPLPLLSMSPAQTWAKLKTHTSNKIFQVVVSVILNHSVCVCVWSFVIL